MIYGTIWVNESGPEYQIIETHWKKCQIINISPSSIKLASIEAVGAIAGTREADPCRRRRNQGSRSTPSSHCRCIRDAGPHRHRLQGLDQEGWPRSVRLLDFSVLFMESQAIEKLNVDLHRECKGQQYHYHLLLLFCCRSASSVVPIVYFWVDSQYSLLRGQFSPWGFKSSKQILQINYLG
jgi:hypothetical protein